MRPTKCTLYHVNTDHSPTPWNSNHPPANPTASTSPHTQAHMHRATREQTPHDPATSAHTPIDHTLAFSALCTASRADRARAETQILAALGDATVPREKTHKEWQKRREKIPYTHQRSAFNAKIPSTQANRGEARRNSTCTDEQLTYSPELIDRYRSVTDRLRAYSAILSSATTCEQAPISKGSQRRLSCPFTGWTFLFRRWHVPPIHLASNEFPD